MVNIFIPNFTIMLTWVMTACHWADIKTVDYIHTAWDIRTTHAIGACVVHVLVEVERELTLR